MSDSCGLIDQIRSAILSGSPTAGVFGQTFIDETGRAMLTAGYVVTSNWRCEIRYGFMPGNERDSPAVVAVEAFGIPLQAFAVVAPSGVQPGSVVAVSHAYVGPEFIATMEIRYDP